jgi:hypothetical protein
MAEITPPEIPQHLLTRLEDLAAEVAFTAEMISLIAIRAGGEAVTSSQAGD